MNDRTRNIIVRIIAVIGSSTCAILVITFGVTKSILGAALLATLAGTFGHLAFTALGSWLMRLEKRWSLGKPGDCLYAFGKLPAEVGPSAGGKGRVLANLYQKGFPVPDGFETVLDVRTNDEIRAAVEAVRASRHSERVQAYTQAKEMETGEHPIAMIIQRLIQAEYSGVLFTANPLTGNLMQMTGNFVPGMGEKLVSGQVSAAEFTFERTAGIYKGPAELQPVAKLLHLEAHKIESELGCPQDIEWAIVGKKLFILQSRPITTLNGFNPITAETNDSLKGNFLWSATNLIEACPEVQTPFTASLLSYLAQRGGPALSVKNYPLNGIIGGRFYANISVQVSAFAPMFKGDAHRAYREMSGWWGEIPSDMDIPMLPLTKQEWQQTMLPNLWRTNRVFGRYRKQVPVFLKQNRRRCVELCEKVRHAVTKDELLALWNQEIFPAYRDAMFLIIATGSDLQVRLERDLRQLVGADDANALLSNLGGKSGRLESLGPMAGLGMVLRGEMSREEYLENYGHRGVNEGECAWPRPAEDPHWLDRQLAEWERNPVDVEALLDRQRIAYQAAWERVCQKHPSKVKSMQKRLEQVSQAAQRRELIRSEATRGMTVLRAFALRAGEMLEIREGVFFLTIDEVTAALAGQAASLIYINTRQASYQRYQALPPYPAVICGRFEPFAWAADPNRRPDIFDARLRAVSAEGDDSSIIHGTPGVLGVVEGMVRRLECIDESSQFQPGEVLVTTMTNIGWTPLFPRAAAIITDLGAPLSHAAIVARELGIPAVVGCGNATTRLKTGDRVRVDGGRGLVEIIN